MVVSYGHHYAVKDRQFRRFRCRDEHPPLEHILQKAGGFEAHALSACVGAGDKEDAFLGRESYRKRHNCLFLTLQGPFQKGMAGFSEPQGAILAHNRHSGNIGKRHIGFGHDEIQLSYKLRAGNEFRHKRPQELCELIEDLCNFTGFGKVQL